MTVKKITFVFITLIFLGFILNEIYSKFFFSVDLKKYASPFYEIIDPHKDKRLLYFSDISENVPFSDKKDLSIGELLEGRLKSNVLLKYNADFADAETFRILLENIPPESDLQSIIIPINLRTLSKEWKYAANRIDLENSMLLLQNYPPLFNRLDLAFKSPSLTGSDTKLSQKIKDEFRINSLVNFENLTYKSIHEWERNMALAGIRNDEDEYDHMASALACHYIKSYAYPIASIQESDVLKEYERIIQLADHRSWNIIFHLLPLNVEEIESLCGPQLLSILYYNQEMLKAYFSKRNVSFIDNLFEIADGDFIKSKKPREIYHFEGRKKIANSIVEVIEQLHPEYLYNTETNYFDPVIYLLDCEQHTNFDELKYSKFRSRSGRFSSRVHEGNPYSVTFEKRIISGNTKVDSLGVAFYLWGKETNESKLILEFIPDDNSFEKVWKSMSLEDGKLKFKGRWNQISKLFKTEELINKNGILKVYVFNPSKNPIYIDDLKMSLYHS